MEKKIRLSRSGRSGRLNSVCARFSPIRQVGRVWLMFRNPSTRLPHKFLRRRGARARCSSRQTTSSPNLSSSFTVRCVSHATRAYALLIRSSPPEIVHVDETLDAAAWQLLKVRADKNWSQVDCASFVLMQQRGVAEACTRREVWRPPRSKCSFLSTMIRCFSSIHSFRRQSHRN